MPNDENTKSMLHTDRLSGHSSIICPVRLNVWIFVEGIYTVLVY